jgi:hypothetical protein
VDSERQYENIGALGLARWDTMDRAAIAIEVEHLSHRPGRRLLHVEAAKGEVTYYTVDERNEGEHVLYDRAFQRR